MLTSSSTTTARGYLNPKIPYRLLKKRFLVIVSLAKPKKKSGRINRNSSLFK